MIGYNLCFEQISFKFSFKYEEILIAPIFPIVMQEDNLKIIWVQLYDTSEQYRNSCKAHVPKM